MSTWDAPLTYAHTTHTLPAVPVFRELCEGTEGGTDSRMPSLGKQEGSEWLAWRKAEVRGRKFQGKESISM